MNYYLKYLNPVEPKGKHRRITPKTVKNIFSLLPVIFCVLAFSVNIQAQDSLSYYMEQAALNNPGLKAKYTEYEAALEKVPQASSLPDPELQIGYFLKPMELLGGNQVADIKLMQMFPWFGTLKAAGDEASKMALVRFESFRNARNELYYNVKASYFKVCLLKEDITIAGMNLRLLNDIEKLITVRISSGGKSASSSSGMNGNMNKSGGVDMVNLLKVRMEISNLENRLALLKDQLVTEETGFNRYLNRPPGSMVFTVDSLRAEKVPADINELADSLAGNPVVRMYKAQSEAGSAMLSKAKKLGLPKVGVGIDYMLIQQRAGNSAMMNGNDMAMPMISFTLPVYRKKYRAMQREAELTRDAASLSAASTRNDLEVSYRQTIQALNDAGRRIKLYEGQTLLAERSIQLLITSFSTGETDLDDVLRMEQQLLAYRLDHAGAVADLNTALAKLLFLTGNE